MNGVMMQGFHWYIAADGTHWKTLQQQAEALKQSGFTALWLPPAYKGAGGGNDVGYGVYDIFDLGEFDQKGSVRTKYGTKEEYLAAIKTIKGQGLQIYADVVFNHRDGGDRTERIKAIPFDRQNREQALGPAQEIESYTAFDFPGRGDRYSTMKWNRNHFDSVNHNMLIKDDSNIYLFEGQGFEKFVDLEKGNYDFLLGCDLDMDNEQVQGELNYWGRWYTDTVGIDGFRIDAVKHMPSWFFKQWIDQVRSHAGKRLFCVGEYWSAEVQSLHSYLSATEGRMSLFDVPLQRNFHKASQAGANYDLRTLFDGTLTQQQPSLAVTFVENHDTQPCQALESPVEPWFKPLAYALILLRQEGYPCVFYPDYYGAEYPNSRGGYPVQLYSHKFLLDRFLEARRDYGYGDQVSYFDHPSTIGWTRLGDAQHPRAMAVVMTNGESGYKWMNVQRPKQAFLDITGHCAQTVTTNPDGWGRFPCNAGSVSVWVEKA